MFDDVQEGSVVLIATGYKRPVVTAERVHCDSAVELVLALENLKSSRAQAKSKRAVLSGDAPLFRWDDVFDMRVGVVTGDNDSFVLNEKERVAARLPLSAVVPIVGRARHIAVAEVPRAHWERLKKKGVDVWLFRPSAQARRSKHVKDYIESIEPAKRYFKVTARRDWTRPDVPHVPHGFLTGMSIHGPWIALSRCSNLLATNTLYTVRFKTARSNEDRAAIALGLLTTIVRKQLPDVQRIYPDGLPKLEPRDLRRLTIPVKRGDGRVLETYRAAVTALLKGEEGKATALADAWFASAD